MNIHVIPAIAEARSEELLHKTVIVIDVLRATSTMLTAFASGCSAILPVETVIGAKTLAQSGELLGGERNCRRIPGFDLGNSPLEYTRSLVSGQTIIMTTTNGTRAIQKAAKAGRILIGSLLNARACAARAAQFKEDIVILCSGTQDVFSLEDGLGAGAILHELIELKRGESEGAAEAVVIDDFGTAMLEAYRSVQHRLEDALLSSANGRRLTRIGFREDVVYCAGINRIDIAAEVRGSRLERVELPSRSLHG